MADLNRILELVVEVLCSDQSPEEVCGSDPELVWDVRAHLDECRRVDSMVESIFPSTPPQRVLSARFQPGASLPEIPGYEVLAVLGRGGHGIVYRVRHLQLKRVAALKMLLTGQYATPAELARFMREAEAIAALQHPNIVQIYDIGEVDGRPYFTMELVGGGSLAQKLGGVPQPAREAASITEALANAIHTAHRAGIIHRDVKPANILLTADGTPKITDFGLARFFEGQPDVTLGPAKVGTPSYMAPEQVIGEPGTVGPSADIYALGATLYELLTGRPPFRADSSSETERQVLTQEPAPPSRLNARVARDLETICLKCLQKEPSRRYESAAALADDLERFWEDRPIRARPVGRAARVWRWSRRNPAAAALVTMSLSLAMTAIAGGIWFVQQRAEQRAAAVRHDAELHTEIATTLSQAASFRKGFHFQEARELLEEASRRLEPTGPDDLRQRVAQCQVDLSLVEQLDAARFQRALIVGGRFDPLRPESFYASAFARAGLGKPGDGTSMVAALVKHSSASAEIVDALDDWASITPDRGRRKWLFDIARLADPDPQRNLVRQPALWDNPGGRAQPIPELQADKISPRMATALARLIQMGGDDAIAPLVAVQARMPQDFWLNFELGIVSLRAHRQDDALGYARAALALRPQSSAAHNAVGLVLQEMGRVDEAIDQYHKALAIDPRYAEALFNLGDLLRSQGKYDEAIGHFREALQTDPTLTEIYIDLGNTLQDENRLDDAISAFRQAIRLSPRDAKAHNNLASVLRSQGRLDDAIAELRKATDIDPNYAVGQINLGEALWAKGQLEEGMGRIQQATRMDLSDCDVQFLFCHHLYADACAAVRETTRRGAEKPPLDETIRANLRLRALDWLRADLDLVIQLVNEGQAQATSLFTWENEPALAAVRDPAELAKLPSSEREQWHRFWAVVASEIVTDPVTQARERVARSEWMEAARLYAQKLTRGTDISGGFWFEYAAVQLLCGNRRGYARGCAELIKRCGKPDGPRAYDAARAGTLAPKDAADLSLLARLANDELQSHATEFWSLTERGALAYRTGRFQESVGLVEKSLKADSHPGRAVIDWLWLAMANQRLGKTDEARRWLETAQSRLNQFRDGMPDNADAIYGLHLHNWLEANILRREAEALIAPK